MSIGGCKQTLQKICKIFTNGTKPTVAAGASVDDQLPVTSMTIEDNNDDSNDKVERNDDNNDKSKDSNALTTMAIPTGRGAT